MGLLVVLAAALLLGAAPPEDGSQELARLAEDDLIERLSGLPQGVTEIGALVIRIIGLILFVGDGSQ